MLRQSEPKSHTLRWAEAERELAIRGVFPAPPASAAYFPMHKEAFTPPPEDDKTLKVEPPGHDDRH